jgi:Zn-finger nucleic acid-binding protein
VTLGGAGPVYRDAPVRCPGCGEGMRPEITTSGTVDVCDACGGSWVDWFDGDVHTIAAETEALRVERGTPLPPPADLAARPGPMQCPRCARGLTAELYRFADAQEGEWVGGVEVGRCAECAGAFVPRGSAYLLLERAKEGPPSSPWEALTEVLAAFVARLFRTGGRP